MDYGTLSSAFYWFMVELFFVEALLEKNSHFIYLKLTLKIYFNFKIKNIDIANFSWQQPASSGDQEINRRFVWEDCEQAQIFFCLTGSDFKSDESSC